jgi:outer membrane protein assembly factor BamB
MPLSGGFSSIVVADGRLFTQTKEPSQEVVVCLDPATGKDIWRYRYDCDYKSHRTFTGGGAPYSRTGPRASPAVDGDFVYALGATGTLLCLEASSGKRIWQQDLLKLAGRACPIHGFCGSPLVVGSRLYLNLGGPDGKSIVALDKEDGSLIWHALDDPIGYTTPVWADVAGQSQVVFLTGAAAVGANPQDGSILWRYPWKTQYNLHIATPIYSDSNVFISSDYGTGAALFHLTGGKDPEIVWKSKAMQNHFSSCVLYQGYLYGFSEARLRCVEFQNGKIKWDKEGLGKGSLLIADGKLFALGDHGQLVLAEASPSHYHEISRCQILDPNALTWTVPTLANGRLFVRNENLLVALDVRSP